MKQIPNLFTLLNLICGCMAIVLVLQTGETIVILNYSGATQVTLPEKMAWGSVFIFAAAAIDFLDGFLARLLRAESGMGKQLDSLSDVVSFGVAPGIILYQLLRIGFAREENGIDTSIFLLLPAFIFPAAVAWRLAKFNISTDQGSSFKGVPSPAAGLVVASFPLIIWNEYFGLQEWFINEWFLYGVILILAWLMNTDRRFLAAKFKNYRLKENAQLYLLILLSVISVFFLGWLSVPVIFVLYILFSAFVVRKQNPAHAVEKETVDVTV